MIEAEKILKQHPEIDHFFSSIGGFTTDTGAADGAVTDGQVNSALIYVTLKPKANRSLGQFDLMDALRKELNAIPDVVAVPQDLASHDFIAGRGFPIEAQSSRHRLQSAGAKIAGSHLRDEAVRRLPGHRYRLPHRHARGAHHSRPRPRHRLRVTVDTIAATVDAAIGGTIQGKFTNKDRRYDVRLRLEGGQRMKPEDILSLDVRTITAS